MRKKTPSCVCDICKYGMPDTKECYKGGVVKCIKSGEYTLFENCRGEKQAYWLSMVDGLGTRYMCSNCYSNFNLTGDECPECGSVMKGVAEW